MNPSPRLHGRELGPGTCGRTACENDARAFWQSRMTTAGARAEPLQLVDLHSLARDVRRAFKGANDGR